MDARQTMKVGVVLSVLAIPVSLYAVVLASDPVLGQSAGPFFNLAGLLTLLGLFLLVLAVYKLAGLPAMPPLVLAGAALFLLGRLVPLLLNLVLDRNARNDPAISLLFSALNVISTLGTVLFLVGVFRALQGRLEGAPALARRPAKPVPAPAPAPARAPPSGAPRRSSIKPPQAPLPPAKGAEPGGPR